MMGDLSEKIGAVIAGIISLAVLAIVISTRANTSNVLSSFFGGLSNLIGVAISPITGQSVSGLSGAGLTGGSWLNGSTSSTSNYVSSALGGFSNILGGLNTLGTASSGSGSSGSGSSGLTPFTDNTSTF